MLFPVLLTLLGAGILALAFVTSNVDPEDKK